MTKVSLATQMRVKKNAARAAGKTPDVDTINAKAKKAADTMNADMALEAKKDSKRTARRILRKVANAAAVDALKGVSAAGTDLEKLSGLAARAAVAAVRALQDACRASRQAGQNG
jgi:glutamine synthetase adenylyltransferase